MLTNRCMGIAFTSPRKKPNPVNIDYLTFYKFIFIFRQYPINKIVFKDMRYRYLTRADIDQMKASGYDPVTIEEAELEFERLQPKFQLIEQIKSAFLGVKLGNGIGLKEADGIDDYADEETLACYRITDEKKDWQVISVDTLNRYHCSLSYFDVEGMRFYLPAYLIAELKGEYRHELIFTLTYLDKHSKQKFSLLNQEQRKVIRDFLEWAMDDDDYQLDREK